MNRPPFCASSPEAQALSDADFWDAVYPQPTEDEVFEHWLDEINRETWVIECARCGRAVEVDEDTRHERERDAFCDDCALEHLPEDEWQPYSWEAS